MPRKPDSQFSHGILIDLKELQRYSSDNSPSFDVPGILPDGIFPKGKDTSRYESEVKGLEGPRTEGGPVAADAGVAAPLLEEEQAHRR